MAPLGRRIEGDRVKRYGHWIDGRGRAPEAGVYITSTSLWTGSTLAEIPSGNSADVAAAVISASSAFAAWRALKPGVRGRLLADIAAGIRAEQQLLADLEGAEAGKPAAQSLREVDAAASYFDFYAGLANIPSGEVIDLGPGMHGYTIHEPYGVIGVITPWNAPLNQAARAVVPALLAGNVAVVKPSEFTSASMVELAQLFMEAGFPAGVVNVVTGLGPEVGEALVTHRHVAHIGFTGGSAAGRKIYELAARNFKTVTLELGGKSPNIVFEDADLDQAVKGVVSGIFAATGQSCQAGSRLLLQRSIHDKFVAKLVEFMRDVKLGDPTAPETQIGPVATRPQFNKVLEYIQIAKDEGATCVLGGKSRPDLGAGQFVEPTIFTGVRNDMRIAQEEVFGPVLAVIPFEDEAEAVAIGNDVAYGLAAAVWTQNLRRAMAMVEKLQAGTVWVNNYRATSFTSPFGGYKESGIGRESGTETIKEYLNTKCVWISTDLDVPNPFVRR